MSYNTYIRINLKTLTHIKTLCFWLKCNNGLVSCEGQQKWLRVVTVVFRTIGLYVITSTFFNVFLRFFSKSKKSWLFTFFAVFHTFSRTMHGVLYIQHLLSIPIIGLHSLSASVALALRGITSPYHPGIITLTRPDRETLTRSAHRRLRVHALL